MKKIFSIILAVFMLTALGGAPPGASAAQSGEGAFYLIDETFSIMQDARAGGWDIKAAGGSLRSVYNDFYSIADNSAMLSVVLNRKFLPQSAGKLTLEFCFSFNNYLDGAVWQLRSGAAIGVGFLSEGGALYLESGGDKKLLSPIAEKTSYGIKAHIDLDAKKADVYVNGALKAESAPFYESVGALDNFEVNTGEEAVGEMVFGPVKLYKGYIINERLLALSPGQFPADWSAEGGGVSVEKAYAATKPDIFSFALDDTSASKGLSLSKSFAPQGGALTFEYKMFFKDKANGVSAKIHSGGEPIFGILTSGGRLCYQSAGGAVPFYDYIENLWYSFKVSFDEGGAKIFLNGKPVASDIALASAAPIDRVSFSTGAAEKCALWLDDILLYETAPPPPDYVPAPAVAASPEHIIGIQSCSLWREGHHIGWDHITGYPERIPYLGFYDEGSPEVADWEIKWLVEHGVDFQMFCWFRPRGGEGESVKDPYQVSALHDGYFNARYSDLLDFAIMWENGNSNCAGSEDFRENLVPYWVEYYFKDPRYLKIDNKPLFSFISYGGLKRDFGDEPEKIKAETDYLRNAAKTAGFDDLIIITTYNSSNKAEMENIKNSGIDYIYAYSWGYSTASVDTQISFMQNQANAPFDDIIPSPGMGRNDDPWGRGDGQGAFAELDEYERLLNWVKNSFMPARPEGSLAQSMVLLDNWNEFGEGHFLMPAGLAGFGYLDAIRRVFAPGSEPRNTVPTSEQLDRFTKLYPRGRYVPPRVIPAPPAVPETVIKGWYFEDEDDYEMWAPIQQVSGLRVEGGALRGTSLGVNPVLVNREVLSLDINSAPYLRVKIQNSSPAAKVKVYFITEGDPVWDEEKHVSFFTGTNVDEYADYDVLMQANPRWRGELRQLRIDPVNTNADFAIDSMEILSSPEYSGIKVSIDGTEQNYDPAPIIKNGRTLAPLRAVFESMGASVDWDGETREITAFRAGRVIELKIDDIKAFINKKEVILDQPPIIENDRTFVPLRFIGEALEAEVDWFDEERTVLINFYVDRFSADNSDIPKGENLIPDPGMEGSLFKGGTWQAEAAFVKAPAHSGKQSLEVKSTAQYGSASYPVDIRPGVKYYYGGYARLSPDSVGSVVQLILSYQLESGNREQKILKTSSKLSANYWTEFSCEYEISGFEKVSNPQIAFFIDKPSGRDTFYLDDIAVIAID